MAKRTTKAETALEEARQRVQEAKNRRDSTRSQLDIAQAIYEAQADAFDSLQRALAREPRKPAPKSQTAASAKSKSLLKRLEAQSAANTETETVAATSAAVCAVPNCELPEWAPIHSKETADYHVFHAAIKTQGAGV